MNDGKKTALITGSTSGIGLEIATTFAEKGHHVILNGFGDVEKIQKTAALLASKHQVDVSYIPADLSKVNEIEAMVHTISKTKGSVDIIVNNAGIQHVCPIETFPVEKWDAIIALNLTAAFHLSRLCIPLMKKKNWGRLINIASSHALVASPFKSAYVASKHGLAGLTKAIALEVATHNITCNAICPGYVRTPLVERQLVDIAEARGITQEQAATEVLLANQPTKRFVTTREVAEFAAYLCSDFATSINGALLSIDGGWTAH